MVGLESPPLLDPALGELVLRVRGTSRDGQVVRLRSPKCTIGSARHCTLRLAAHGVQPLHCLILRGGHTTLVRRWAPDTLLNGRGFADAELVPGDRLTIGPIDLEVLQPDGSPAAATPRRPTPVELRVGSAGSSVDLSPAAPDESEMQRANLDRRRADLERSRCEWDRQQAECQQRFALEQDQLHRQCSELQSQQRAFSEERQLWEIQQRTTEGQLAARAAELESQAAELEAQRSAIEEERDRQKVTLAENDRELAERTEVLNARQAELAEQCKTLDKKQRALERERLEWESQCHRVERERQGELDSLRAELVRAKQRLEDQFASSGTVGVEREPFRNVEEREEKAEPAPEPAAPADNGVKEPVNLTEVFRNMGINPFSDEEPPPPRVDVPGEAGPVDHGSRDFGPFHTPTPETTAEPLGRPTIMDLSHARPAAAAHESEGDEESIQAYMSRLLQRAGVSPESIAHDAQPSPARSSSEPAPAAASQPAASPTVPTTVSQHKLLQKLPPRSAAPERAVPLSAMRELANLQAQSAIHRYARFRAGRSVAAKMVLTVTAALCGAVLLLIWRHTENQDTLYAAAASLVVALWGTERALLSSREIMHLAKPRATGNKEPVEPVASVDDFSADAPELPAGAAVEDWQGLLGGMGPPQERMKDEG